MLEQEYKTFYKDAEIIPNWKTMNKNKLVNDYIVHENDSRLRSAYFSAIMLRYWGNIGKYYTKSKASGFTVEDCYSWLLEAIIIALRYRRWLNKNSQLYGDPNAPDKVINRCIYSRRQYYYYLANRNNRKSNHMKIGLSDLQVEDDKNAVLSDDECNKIRNIVYLISALFKHGNYLGALTINSLFFGKIDVGDNSLMASKIAGDISNLTSLDISTISTSYGCDINKIEDIVGDLSTLPYSKKRVVVEKTLDSLKNSKLIKEFIN